MLFSRYHGTDMHWASYANTDKTKSALLVPVLVPVQVSHSMSYVRTVHVQYKYSTIRTYFAGTCVLSDAYRRVPAQLLSRRPACAIPGQYIGIYRYKYAVVSTVRYP